MRIAQVGTFDIDNLGDLLFPVVFDRLLAELSAELDIPIECTCFSPRGMPAGQLYRDQRGSLPLQQLEHIDSREPFDLVFIGGGDIIRDDDASLASIYPSNGVPPAFSHLSSPTKAADRRLVLLTPGVPFALSSDFRSFLANSFRRVRFAAVRDRFSAERLAEVVPADVRLSVLPDIAGAIAHFYPRAQLRVAEDSLVPPELQRSGYICFQAQRSGCADVNRTGQALRHLQNLTGLPVLLMEMGQYPGDDPFLSQLAARFSFALVSPHGAGDTASVMQKVAVIAGSQGFVGTSLHGPVLAHAYGVPHVSFSGARLSKIRGFYETCPTGICYPSHAECFAQLDAIGELIGGAAGKTLWPAGVGAGLSDYARIRNFVRKALISATDRSSRRSSDFAVQVDSRYRRYQSERQRRFEVRIDHLHFPALAVRYPRVHIAVRRSIKFLWWSVTLRLLRKYRERREQFGSVPGSRTHRTLAVPFAWAPSVTPATSSVAVILHLYFEDMAPEFKDYLANIPFAFDLCITTDSQAKKRRIENVFEGWDRGRMEVRICCNRGRDIAPKLITCADVHARYEYVLHIHSKRSPYGALSAGWRKYLLETLIGSPDIVASIFEIFRSSPRVGMIAPQHLEGIPAVGWAANHENAEAFCRRFALNLDFGPRIDYPSGSMFWARSAALLPILNAGLTFEDFATESGQVNGTLAHVIERLYFCICEAAGYEWVKIAKPDLLRDPRNQVVDIHTPEELRLEMECEDDRFPVGN